MFRVNLSERILMLEYLCVTESTTAMTKLQTSKVPFGLFLAGNLQWKVLGGTKPRHMVTRDSLQLRLRIPPPGSRLLWVGGKPPEASARDTLVAGECCWCFQGAGCRGASLESKR